MSRSTLSRHSFMLRSIPQERPETAASPIAPPPPPQQQQQQPPTMSSPPSVTAEQWAAMANAASSFASDLWYTRCMGAFTVTMGTAALLYAIEPPFVLWTPDEKWIFPLLSQERVWTWSICMGLLSFSLSVLRSVPKGM